MDLYWLTSSKPFGNIVFQWNEQSRYSDLENLANYATKFIKVRL